MVNLSACSNPRGNLWLNDQNKVGLKLMQKMGWSEGKGLGAKEDGMKEAVKVRPNSDAKGVGFRHNRDNVWLDHQDEFNALLSRLNNGNGSSSTSMRSLEEKSRSSRSRLHYQKFTRGKDLSACSEKELACILGKPKRNTDAALGGSNIVINKMSYHDYFSQKQSMLEKSKEQSDPGLSSSSKKHKQKKDESCTDDEECLSETEKADEEIDYLPKKQKRDRKKVSVLDAEEHLSETEKEKCVYRQTTGQISKKRKREKNNKTSHDYDEGLPEAEKEDCKPLQTTQCLVKEKKSKRRQDLSYSEQALDLKVHEVKIELDSDDGITKTLDFKETRRKKHRNDERKLSTPELLDTQIEGEASLKKRKRKLESGSGEIRLEEDCIQENTEIEVKSNKKKFKRIKAEADCNNMITSIEDKVTMDAHEPEQWSSTSEPENVRIKKSKRKKKSDKSDELVVMESANSTTDDELLANKKEFVIGLLTTFRHPSESLPDLFEDIMSSEHFNGSNFFSIKGYGEKWL